MASSTSQVSVSESSDSEQPTESSDLTSTASSSMPSDGPIYPSLIDHVCCTAKTAQYQLSAFLSIRQDLLNVLLLEPGGLKFFHFRKKKNLIA